MSAVAPKQPACESGFAGLRLTAEEFFALPDDGNRYELIDGVLIMSPSPTPRHQLVAKLILRQLDDFVERQGLGLVLYETDVWLRERLGGGEVVYRPEIMFIAAVRLAEVRGRIQLAPDLVVEVISPESRGLDTRTKFADYERAGVREYWLIDPPNEEMRFYRLADGRFVEAPASESHYESAVVPGFRLELARIRAAFRML